MLMVEMDIGITLTADNHLGVSYGFRHFVELSCHLLMLQDMGKPLVSQPNRSPKPILQYYTHLYVLLKLASTGPSSKLPKAVGGTDGRT